MTDHPAVGEVVIASPTALSGHRRLMDTRYVVADVHDFRDEPHPALYLTLVEESVYRYYMDREGGIVADWSPWHVVVDTAEVTRVQPAAAETAQYSLFGVAA